MGRLQVHTRSCPQAVFLLRCYTVGVAGLAVNQLPSGSGGSTPSQRTKIVLTLNIVYDRVVIL